MSVYPPVGFHFSVEFEGLGGIDSPDAFFQEVSGLGVEFEMENRNQGGRNNYTHPIPVRSKYQDVTLKRGLFTNSAVLDWTFDAFENLNIVPKMVTIKLLNENHQPLITFNLSNAYPKKWSLSNFNAEQNQLVLETYVLAYENFRIAT